MPQQEVDKQVVDMVGSILQAVRIVIILSGRAQRFWLLSVVTALLTIAACSNPASPPASNNSGATGNSLPVSSFNASCSGVDCVVDGSGSADADGSISSYNWNYGDGSSSSGVSTSHSYSADGTYTVTLQVTDNEGATASASQSITLVSGNLSPVAQFTANCLDLSCSFDASASTDGDGAIVSYAWDFGDASTGTGVSTSHIFAGGGNYSVTLTVTDNRGSTASRSEVIAINGGVDGRALYQKKCSTCHGDDGLGGTLAKISIQGSTAEDITTAIASVKNMKSLSSLTTAEIQGIADYLAVITSGVTATGSSTWSKITLYDSNGATKSITSDPASGYYLVDTGKLSGPVLAQAFFPEQNTALYGYSAAAGVINITPLTNQVLNMALSPTILPTCFENGDAALYCHSLLNSNDVDIIQLWLADQLRNLFLAYNLSVDELWMNQPFDPYNSPMAQLLNGTAN